MARLTFRQLREKAGITSDTILSERAGVTRICCTEAHAGGQPSAENLKKLAAALKCDPARVADSILVSGAQRARAVAKEADGGVEEASESGQ